MIVQIMRKEERESFFNKKNDQEKAKEEKQEKWLKNW